MVSAELRIYRDVSRARRLPVRLRRGAPGAPLILFSPGFGGTCWDYEGLTLPWHEAGYHVVLLEHPGSALWQALQLAPRRLFRSPQQLRRYAHTPDEVRQRPLDALFLLEHLERELKPRAVAIAGHSFGSYTALALGFLGSVSAVMALSPHPPGWLFPPEQYARLDVPCLMVTGTRDHPYQDRLEAIALSGAERLVVESARHMDFAGWGPRRVVREASAAGLSFWRRCLG